MIEDSEYDGREYRGFLYAGLMLTQDGPKVLEFNARFGDPETQVVLPMIDADLLPLLGGRRRGARAADADRFRPEPHVGVVLASGGYPGSRTRRPGRSTVSTRPAALADVLVFHAGTAAAARTRSSRPADGC